MKTIEQKIEQCRKWQKAARERAIARQREKLADPVWRESQYQKMRDTLDRRIAKQKERPPASKTRKSAVKIKSCGLKGRTPTAEERRIANALGALPCIACYMHGVISNEVSLHHIVGRTAPGCHKKQLPLCRWHHQHAAPAEVRAKYPWLVPVGVSLDIENYCTLSSFFIISGFFGNVIFWMLRRSCGDIEHR
ncbi:Ref family recombination enhancement nuclease [Escherichia coli]|uniref:Ref family recombination enhancement nuclease n=1 Tax=Escherichia coli TaxID=562 RepID=UPI0028AC5E1F|nr:Ref family recombination enhancement nuclease [Escherichia coli]